MSLLQRLIAHNCRPQTALLVAELILLVAAAMLFTAAASVVLFHMVEDPMIRLGKRLTRSMQAGRQSLGPGSLPQAALSE